MSRWCSKTVKSISRPSAPSPWPVGSSPHADEGKSLVEMYNLNQMEDLKAETGDSTAETAKRERQIAWTKTHSWYTVMGGFAIDMRHLPRGFVPGSPRFQTLSADGFLLLARCKPELIPDLSEEDILDKSKSDGFKKFMICVQATWFLVSTIFRLANGYPIALLELNTFAHALCALLVYFIWWSKPLDVAGSTIIDGRLCEDLVATLAMFSNYADRRELELFRYQPENVSDPRVRFDVASFGCPPPSKIEGDGDGPLQAVSLQDNADPESTLPVPDSCVILQMGQTLHGFRFEPTNTVPLAPSNPTQQQPCIVLNAGDVLRWQRASAFVDHFLKHDESDQSFIDFRGDSSNPELNPDHVSSLLVERVQNWPTNILSFTRFQKEHISTHIAFTLAGNFYGGLHLAAVNAPFHNRLEYTLWMLSSAGLCASGPGALIALYANFLRDWFNRTQRDSSRQNASRMKKMGMQVLRLGLLLPHAHFFYFYLPTLAVFLLFSRVFLIVECFMNLTRLDPDVFAIPSWTAYFPHVN